MTTDPVTVDAVVTEYQTMLCRYRIVRAGPNEYVWSITPPPDGPVAACDVSGFVTPELLPGEMVYRIPGGTSLARSLLIPDGSTAAVADAALGAALRALAALHARPVPPPATAPALARLLAWLDGGPPPVPGDDAARARLRALAVERWGSDTTAALAGWARELAAPTTTVLVHGWFSAASIVPDDRGGAVVLAEPGAYTGAAELDLGWLVGELLELATFHTTPAARGTLRTLRTGALRPYPGTWSRRLVAAAAVCRIALHAHDFATYVGWHGELSRYVELCRRLIPSVPQEDDPR